MEIGGKHWAGSALALLPAAGAALAQCAMCKANLANSENPAALARPVNSAILLLFLPTILLLGGLVRLIYQYRNFHIDHDASRSSDTERPSQ